MNTYLSFTAVFFKICFNAVIIKPHADCNHDSAATILLPVAQILLHDINDGTSFFT